MVKLIPPSSYMAAHGDSGSGEERTTSSLDLKVQNGPKRTTPYGVLRSKMPTAQELQRQQQLQEQQEQARKVAKFMTRARTAGALPSGRPNYRPSLEDLTEEELQMAMDRDPELAAAIKAAAAEIDAENHAKRSPYYKNRDGKDSSYSEHPEHLRAMMEEGVPVMQWIILLLLLGAGLFQLRKMLLGPKTEKNGKRHASPRKIPQKGHRKLSKQQKGKRVGSPDTTESPGSPVSPAREKKIPKQKGKKMNSSLKSKAPSAVPILTMEDNEASKSPGKVSSAPDNGNVVATAEAKVGKATKKKKRSAKKTQAKKENKVENLSRGVEEQSQPANVSASDALSTTVAAEAASDKDDVAKSAAATTIEDNGWHTVRKGSASEKRERKNGSKEPDEAQVVEYTSTPPESAETNVTAPKKPAKPPLQSSSEPSSKDDGTSDSVNATLEKASQAEATDAVEPSAMPIASIDDDAALALKLQQEEEKLAQTFTSPVADDSWAEVAPRRSKRKNAGPEASASSPTAMEEW